MASRARCSARFALVAAVALAGCASAPPVAGPAVARAVLAVAGTEYAADWFLPEGEAAALVTLQHGFARDCGHLRETGLRLAAAGLMALCVNASMARGNPALADALAPLLLAGTTAPGGRALPQRIVVGGHSAGAHFAARLGWQLAALAPARLAGALLFDPVAANDSFAEHLAAVSAAGQRPVLAVTANPAACNAQGNAVPALLQLRAGALAVGRDGFVGLQLIERSSHADVEGADTSVLAVLPCGAPQPANTEALRTLAAQWAADMAAGTRTAGFYPGGAYVDGLVAAGRARIIEP